MSTNRTCLLKVVFCAAASLAGCLPCEGSGVGGPAISGEEGVVGPADGWVTVPPSNLPSWVPRKSVKLLALEGEWHWKTNTIWLFIGLIPIPITSVTAELSPGGSGGFIGDDSDITVGDDGTLVAGGNNNNISTGDDTDVTVGGDENTVDSGSNSGNTADLDNGFDPANGTSDDNAYSENGNDNSSTGGDEGTGNTHNGGPWGA